MQGPRCHPAPASRACLSHHAAAGVVPVTPCSSLGLCLCLQGTSCAGDEHRSPVLAWVRAHTAASPTTQPWSSHSRPTQGRGSKTWQRIKHPSRPPPKPQDIFAYLAVLAGWGTWRGHGMRCSRARAGLSPAGRKGGYFGCFLFCFWSKRDLQPCLTLCPAWERPPFSKAATRRGNTGCVLRAGAAAEPWGAPTGCQGSREPGRASEPWIRRGTARAADARAADAGAADAGVAAGGTGGGR